MRSSPAAPETTLRIAGRSKRMIVTGEDCVVVVVEWRGSLHDRTQMGTFVRIVSTKSPDPVAAALFGKTRRDVLGLLYGQAEEAFYLREIVRRIGASPGAVQRELRRLSDSGILRKSRRGRQVYHQANPACPVFPELRSLILKTVGVAGALRAALDPVSSRIQVALVHGSWARGRRRHAAMWMC